jgi:hypothetical protein
MRGLRSFPRRTVVVLSAQLRRPRPRSATVLYVETGLADWVFYLEFHATSAAACTVFSGGDVPASRDGPKVMRWAIIGPLQLGEGATSPPACKPPTPRSPPGPRSGSSWKARGLPSGVYGSLTASTQRLACSSSGPPEYRPKVIPVRLWPTTTAMMCSIWSACSALVMK